MTYSITPQLQMSAIFPLYVPSFWSTSGAMSAGGGGVSYRSMCPLLIQAGAGRYPSNGNGCPNGKE